MKKIIILIITALILLQSAFALENNIYVKAKYSKEQVCTCSPIIFNFDIKNIGSFSEIYSLSVDKQFMDWTVFNAEKVILNPGQQITLYAHLTPDCSFIGTSDLNFYVKTTQSKLKAKIPVTINVNNCYLPYIEPKELQINYTKTTNNLKITNTGSETASYLLVLEAPGWITIEPTTINLEPKQTKTIKLTTLPENIRKGNYEASIVTVVDDSQFLHTINIKLTSKSICSKLLEIFKANLGKILIYSIIILFALLIIFIISIFIKKIKKEKKPKEKQKKEIKEKPKKLSKKSKRTIITVMLFFILAILIEFNLLAFSNKLTFEVKKNVTIPEAVPEAAQVEETYYQNIIDTASIIWNFIKTYYLYIIIGAAVLAAIVVLLFLIIKKSLKIKRIKEEKFVEKEKKEKEEKRIKTKLSKKNLIRILFVVLPVIILAVAGILLWTFIKLYFVYLIVAFVLLAVVIILIIFIKKRKKKKPKKPKVKPEKKKVKEKKKVEKKITKPKRKKVSNKTLKSLLIAAVIFVLLMALALFVLLNYEKISLLKPEKNFLENFFDKTKTFMATSLNITKYFKTEEIPGVVFEKGIPPQKWQINTLHTLDLNNYFSDPDRDPLNYSSTQPENIAVEIEDNIATFSPEYNWTGFNTVVFTADDSKGGIIESNEVYLVVQEEEPQQTIDLNKYKTKITALFTDIKNYITFYLNYIIAGLVILVILILIITYNKRLLKLVEEPKRKKK